MATVAHINFETVDFAGLLETVELIAAQGDSSEMGQLMQDADRHVDSLIAQADAAKLLAFGARLTGVSTSTDAHNEATAALHATAGLLTARIGRHVSVLEQAAQDAAEDVELTGVRGRVLGLIQAKPGICSSDIADELDLQRSQVSRAVRELANRQLIARAGDETDGRNRRYRSASVTQAAA